MLAFAAATCLVLAATGLRMPDEFQVQQSCNNIVHYPEEKHLANVRQLTFGGENAEAYFSFDNTKLIFQSTAGFGNPNCDQIFEFDWTTDQVPRLVSTGLGTTTCSYFFADNKHMLYASTHEHGLMCQPKLCGKANQNNQTIQHICDSQPFNYTWDIFPQFDIYKTNEQGVIIQKLTDEWGYDAEATISPDGKSIVYTSTAGGDLDLWTMNIDGTNKRQVTNVTGYDGGAYFSPDSKRLVLRASRPKTQAQIDAYNNLLHTWGIVSPTEMEIFTVNADGNDLKQVTNLGMANWAPFWHPSGDKIVFSSNHNTTGFHFNLWLVDDDGKNAEKITYDPIFDAFPMYSFDGSKLVFISNRNCSHPQDFNIFIADWVASSTKKVFQLNTSVTINIFCFMTVRALWYSIEL